MNASPSADPASFRVGIVYALAACLSWGVLPIYFRAIQAVPALEVLAHRVVWSVVFLLGITALRRQWGPLTGVFRDRSMRRTLMVTTTLIASNWLVFIWSVSHGRLVEASLGYFINPLLNVALGALFLGERIRRWQLVSVGIAGVSIAIAMWGLDHLPWVSFVLAGTFAIYSLLRKQLPVTGVQGLTVETVMVAPLAVAFMAGSGVNGSLVFLHQSRTIDLLLPLSGAFTALPLIWFAEGARRLPLSTLGFLQYLSPTGHLLVAVWVFGEPFSVAHAWTFGGIWLALLLFSIDSARAHRARSLASAPVLSTDGPTAER